MVRDDALDTFLAAQGLSPGDFTFLAGDASNRTYYRARDCLLMDAPPHKGEDIGPFLHIARHLRGLNLAAPEIYAADAANGFVLLQDFGDQLYFDIFAREPAREQPLYELALDVLDHLHAAPLPADVPPYQVDEMTQAAGLICDWYAPHVPRADITGPMRDMLGKSDWTSPVLALRDFHAQNLIWRDGQIGLQAVGLLDFQDAQIGHRFYDAMSLIDDARRDIAPPVRHALLTRVTKGPDQAQNIFECNVVSAQRSLRILGVFTRLCLRDGKPHYIDLIPRVWANLWRNLDHPGLEPLVDACRALPAPHPEYLNGLRFRCTKS